jgi:hypothetical protein
MANATPSNAFLEMAVSFKTFIKAKNVKVMLPAWMESLLHSAL